MQEGGNEREVIIERCYREGGKEGKVTRRWEGGKGRREKKTTTVATERKAKRKKVTTKKRDKQMEAQTGVILGGRTEEG